MVIAREEGIKQSKGKYLCFVDADDFLDVNMLDALLKDIYDEKSDIAICSFEYIDSSYRSIRINHDFLIGNTGEEALISLFLRKCSWSLCAKLFRKELFQNILMPYGVKMGEDGLVCFQAFGRANRVSYIDKSYYKYFQHDSSAVHSFNKSMAQSILSFIDLTFQYRDLYNWSNLIDEPLKNFAISQLFVYYVYGGNLEQLRNLYIVSKYSTKDIIYSNLSLKEKILLIFFLRLNFIAKALRGIVRKRCLRN